MPRMEETKERLSVIPGTVPPPTAFPSGCSFHPRCPFAEDRCTTETPDLEAVRAVWAELLERAPEEMIRRAVVGMLPSNRLGRQLATKLKIYAGAEHPHAAQKPAQLGA